MLKNDEDNVNNYNRLAPKQKLKPQLSIAHVLTPRAYPHKTTPTQFWKKVIKVQKVSVSSLQPILRKKQVGSLQKQTGITPRAARTPTGD